MFLKPSFPDEHLSKEELKKGMTKEVKLLELPSWFVKHYQLLNSAPNVIQPMIVGPKKPSTKKSNTTANEVVPLDIGGPSIASIALEACNKKKNKQSPKKTAQRKSPEHENNAIPLKRSRKN